MNFGKWILVSFVMFALFIGVLVTICVRQDISLVSNNYYKEELAYQEQIQRMNNTRQLLHQPVVKLVDNSMLHVILNSPSENTIGELKLFCPSNANFDRKFKLALSDRGEQIVALDFLPKGRYRLKLFWTEGDKDFYYEEEIRIG